MSGLADLPAPFATGHQPADAASLAHALVAGGLLPCASDRAWSLSPAAVDQIAIVDRATKQTGLSRLS